MSRGRGIENDVVEAAVMLGIGEQLRELVEGGDFRRARAGELLLDLADGDIGKLAPDRGSTRSR
jgi:hypothetical protein